MIAIPEYILANGTAMPALGLGTWNMKDPEDAVPLAFAAGYRHIDTAKIYGTEEGVGRAVAISDIPREDIFITTKLWNADQGYGTAHAAIDASLTALGMSYVDLYLIHWPTTDERHGEDRRQETWRAMEEIYATGKARAIGVSNYEVAHLEEMSGYARTMPMVNQIERHPFNQQPEVHSYCRTHGIQITNYSPLTRAKRLHEDALGQLASKYEKSEAQVLLRWGIEHGDAVIPKASKSTHLEENANIFDFTLDAEDVALLDSLEEGVSVLG